MSIYIILLVWILLIGFFARKKILVYNGLVLDGSKVYIFLSFIFVWAIMAFRSPMIGTDTLAYSEYYVAIAGENSLVNAINNEFISGDFYKCIAYFMGMISQSPFFYIAWTSTLISLGISIYIYRISNWVVFSTFLFFTLNLFFISMNAGRQWIAISLALNALLFIYKNSKSVKGWLLLILAINIHNTILLFLPAFISIILVKKFGANKIIYLLFISFSMALSIFSFVDITNVLSYFPHYIMYVDGSNPDGLLNNTGSGKIIIEYMLFLFVFFLYIIKDRNSEGSVTFSKAVLPAALFSIIVGIMFSKNNLINRILIPYQCLFLVIIPYTVARYKGITRLVLCLFMSMGLLFSYYLWMEGNLGDIIPYETWLTYCF